MLSGGSAAHARGSSPFRTRLHDTRVAGEVAEFVSFRTFLLVTDTSEPERFGLSVRRLYRLWAPQIQENPIFFHATDTSTAGFQLEVDQMAATGFEMLIYSFGTNFNLEDTSPANVAAIGAQIDYAHSKGIEVGGYDLICLQRGQGGYGGNVGKQWDTVTPTGGLGEDACFASGWVDKLTNMTYTFLNRGLSMVETDGPYGGEPCASTNHSGHLQLSDSVYQQTRSQADWYAALRKSNVYINQPDKCVKSSRCGRGGGAFPLNGSASTPHVYMSSHSVPVSSPVPPLPPVSPPHRTPHSYAFFGGQRTGIGYNEDQYNLPPWQDVTVTRMTVYDDTFRKVPSYGWVFVPLVPYHGGADSQFEPMSEHLAEYNMALAQYLLAGVAACYRGYRLYDTPAVQAVVAKWVAHYKAYRDIINADIVHIRRPDGQSIDAFMHASAMLPRNKGLLALFNPTSFALNQTIAVPLYYTGITGTAAFFQEGDGARTDFALARDYSVQLAVSMAPQTATFFVIQDASAI